MATILGFVLFLGILLPQFVVPATAHAMPGELSASGSTPGLLKPSGTASPTIESSEAEVPGHPLSVASGVKQGTLFGIASDDNTPLDFLSETATNSTFTQALSFDVFTSTLKMVTSLAIVIGLVMSLSWFLQQRGGLNRSIFGRTLGVLPLDNRRFLYLVDIMGRVLVLGVTEHSINLLCEITDKASIDALRVQTKAPAGAGLEKMFSFLRRGSSNDSEDHDDGSPRNSSMDFSAHTMNAQQQMQNIEKLLLKKKVSGEAPQDEPSVQAVQSPPSDGPLHNGSRASFSPERPGAEETPRPPRPRDSSPPRPRNLA